jgi:hypothetical protein
MFELVTAKERKKEKRMNERKKKRKKSYCVSEIRKS